MPKEDRKNRSSSNNRRSNGADSASCSHDAKPYQKFSENAKKKRSRSPKCFRNKQWDDINCPICMENPHNAVLLICSQHEKGCRPFMCDTSHRHSNCLDQYRNMQKGGNASSNGGINTNSNSLSLESPLAPFGEAPNRNSDRRRVLVLTHEAGGTQFGAIGLLPSTHMRGRPDLLSNSQTDGLREGRFAWRSIMENHRHFHGGNSSTENGVNGQFPQFRHLRQLHQELQQVQEQIQEQVQDQAQEEIQGQGQGQEFLEQVEVREGVEESRNEDEIAGGARQEKEPIDDVEGIAEAKGKALIAALIAEGETMVKAEAGLLCPLCRSSVFGWKVVKDVRMYLDLKSRACSHESCSFTGAYGILRNHAREIHPSVRPQEANPERVEEWQRLQRQQDTDDVLSSIQAAMPGARILGDYMIEDNNDNDNDDDDDAEAVDGSDSDGIQAVTDLDFLLPIMDIMSQLAASGPAHQRGRGISWGLNIGPSRRRNSFATRSRAVSANNGGGPANPGNPPSNSPPSFPILPPIPLGGAMPSGDPSDIPILPRSRWGDIRDASDPSNVRHNFEFMPRGRGRSADPPSGMEQRHRMVSELFERHEAFRRRLNRDSNSPRGSQQGSHPP